MSIYAVVMRLLLDTGVDYYTGLWGDPLCENGHEDIVQTLLEYGADINAEGRDYCVLVQAVIMGSHE